MKILGKFHELFVLLECRECKKEKQGNIKRTEVINCVIVKTVFLSMCQRVFEFLMIFVSTFDCWREWNYFFC